jgi:Derlin-2/3
MIFLLIFNPLTKILFLSQSLSFAMTYYWGRKSKTTNVEFMGVFTFRAPYLPWFYLVISFLLESDFKNDLYGLLIGHLYFFFKEILPRIKSANNIKILETPKFFIRLCEKLNINNEFIIDVEDGDLLF